MVSWGLAQGLYQSAHPRDKQRGQAGQLEPCRDSLANTQRIMHDAQHSNDQTIVAETQGRDQRRKKLVVIITNHPVQDTRASSCPRRNRKGPLDWLKQRDLCMQRSWSGRSHNVVPSRQRCRRVSVRRVGWDLHAVIWHWGSRAVL